ncbi:alpha/beta hydrolase [Kribbella sp. HUAS MG21]|jgi:proline iminopeptidase|uniref:Alpha/beta hydrolase n=1 Tax=Kribbella sp. HUAS MG21 TaxID=3160966 RepID=A0AAU7TBF7_9ACTN
MRLYVAEYGAADAPALLFIHGHGGGYHWQRCQAERLAQDLRVIAPDQRGVLRSGPLPPGATVDLDALLADFEELRAELGISRWAILGHSAGGNYAVEYAIRHPSVVSAVIFDCPCWDFDANDRHRLPLFAALYEELGDSVRAARCRELAALERRLTAADRTYELAFGLGDRFQDLSFHDPSWRADFVRLGEDAGFTDEMWAYGNSHLSTLDELYTSKLGRLALMPQPSLLIEGVDDLATDPLSVRRYHDTVPRGRVVTFDRSGHFPHFEEPERYAELVRSFLLDR